MTTGVPAGKTNKELAYDLSLHINSGMYDYSSSGYKQLGYNDEVNNQEFVSTFTLSLLMEELMVLAGNHFPVEYELDKKSLGKKCRLCAQNQWNTSSWTEIPSTEMLLWSLWDQMKTKGGGGRIEFFR